jgi:hypothetical protein
MNRFKSHELVLGAVLMLAAVAVAMSLNAAVPPDAAGWSWGLFKDASGFFTFVAVLVASVQAFMFFWQLKYMRGGIEHASSAASAAVDAARISRNAQRPYFTPTLPELRNWGGNGDEHDVLAVWFNVENVGKGVGFLERYAIAHEVSPPDGSISVVPTERSLGVRMPIAADARLVAGAAYDEFQISASDRAEMISNAKLLYVHGYFEYVDLFAIRRRTGFIFEFVPEARSFVMVPHSLWSDVELAAADRAA